MRGKALPISCFVWDQNEGMLVSLKAVCFFFLITEHISDICCLLSSQWKLFMRGMAHSCIRTLVPTSPMDSGVWTTFWPTASQSPTVPGSTHPSLVTAAYWSGFGAAWAPEAAERRCSPKRTQRSLPRTNRLIIMRMTNASSGRSLSKTLRRWDWSWKRMKWWVLDFYVCVDGCFLKYVFRFLFFLEPAFPVFILGFVKIFSFWVNSLSLSCFPVLLSLWLDTQLDLSYNKAELWSAFSPLNIYSVWSLIPKNRF